MIQTIRNAWKVAELRNKLLFTVFALLIFRVGSAIPVPFIDTKTLSDYIQSQSGTIFGLLNVMSGDAFAQATVFALSIQPYINSSIIIQLLTIAIPALERLQKEGGEEGKKKLEAITRYATVAIAIIQAFGFYTFLRVGSNGTSLLTVQGVWPAFVIIAAFVAGSAFLMWLGEQITEFGIGNGISIILFAGIVSRFPRMCIDGINGLQRWITVQGMSTESLMAENEGMTEEVARSYIDALSQGALAPWIIALVVIGMLALVVFIVYINNAERRIPVQYAKRVVGRKM